MASHLPFLFLTMTLLVSPTPPWYNTHFSVMMVNPTYINWAAYVDTIGTCTIRSLASNITIIKTKCVADINTAVMNHNVYPW